MYSVHVQSCWEKVSEVSAWRQCAVLRACLDRTFCAFLLRSVSSMATGQWPRRDFQMARGPTKEAIRSRCIVLSDRTL